MLKCNREVTWLSGKRPCLFESNGSPSVVTSLACACVKSCVELLRSCGINILVVVSDILCVLIDCKLSTTKNIRTCNSFLRASEFTCNSSSFDPTVHLCRRDVIFIPNIESPWPATCLFPLSNLKPTPFAKAVR